MALFLEVTDNIVQSNKQIDLKEALEKQVFVINGDVDNNEIIKKELLELYEYAETIKNLSNVSYNNLKHIDTTKHKPQFAVYTSQKQEHTVSCHFDFYETIDKPGDEDGEKCFIKVFIYDANEYQHVVEAKIVSEIYIQQKAEQIQKTKCTNLFVPKIFSYGFIQNYNEPKNSIYADSRIKQNSYSDSPILDMPTPKKKQTRYSDSPLANPTLKKYFYIKMQKIDGETMDKFQYDTKCKGFVKKIDEINKCLQKNGIYHNDLNAGNIIIAAGKITIIDFGEATLRHSPIDFKLINFCKTKLSRKTQLSRKTSKNKQPPIESSQRMLAKALGKLFKNTPNEKSSKSRGGSIKRRLRRKTKKIHFTHFSHLKQHTT